VFGNQKGHSLDICFLLQRRELMAVKVDNNKCTGCGACVEICPVNAVKIENKKALVDEKECAECGVCINECPDEAISLSR